MTAKADKEGKLDKVNARLEKSESATAALTEAVEIACRSRRKR